MRGVRCVGDDSHLVFRQKLLGEDGIVRRGVVIVKQPGLFSPKFGKISSHVFTQSPQNFAVEPGIHSLACWDRCFAIPYLLYRWRHMSEIFLITPRIYSSPFWQKTDLRKINQIILININVIKIITNLLSWRKTDKIYWNMYSHIMQRIIVACFSSITKFASYAKKIEDVLNPDFRYLIWK
jgi:hypothetical protein